MFYLVIYEVYVYTTSSLPYYYRTYRYKIYEYGNNDSSTPNKHYIPLW